MRPTTASPQPDDRAWRKLYDTARWKRLRDVELTRSPLCARCMASDIVTPATVVHHVVQHKGDPALFWGGPFECLCAPCHNRFGQLEDHGKKTILFDASGWPI